MQGRDNRNLSPRKVTVSVHRGIVSHDFTSWLSLVGCSSAAHDFGWGRSHPGTRRGWHIQDFQRA